MTLQEIRNAIKVKQEELAFAYDQADVELINELEKEIDDLQKQYHALKSTVHEAN